MRPRGRWWTRRAARAWAVALAAAALAAVGIGLALRADRTPAAQTVANSAFRSAPARGTAALVWAVGDGADGNATSREIARRIERERPDRLLYLGDVYETGTAEEFKSGYDTVYGRLTRLTAPTPGNHEWPNRTTGYDPYWRSKTGAATPGWYAFRLGGWRFLSLNSEAPHDPGSPQVRWLERTLARERGTCTLAFWHRPLQSAGKHGDQGDVEPLWNPLRGKASIVVNAHDHNIQRLRPRDGIAEYIAGAGGRSRYKLDASDPRLAFADDQRDGALRIELRPGRAELSFVTVDGTVIDRSAVACRPAAAR